MNLRKYMPLNKKGTGVLLISILLVLIFIEVSYYFPKGNESRQAPVLSVATSTTSVVSGSVCHDSERYFIIEKSKTPDVGTDMLVKFKKSKTDRFSCEYIAGGSDFEIKNVSAEYFLGLDGDYLVLDSGTSPDARSIVVYNLLKKVKVYEGPYSQPINLGVKSIDYWESKTEKVTLANCPDLKSYLSSGLSATIESRIVLDLKTLTKKDTGERRCAAKQ